MAFVHSLRFRLALLLVFVALTPVGVAAILIQRATADAFNDYSSERAKVDAQAIVMQIDALTGQQFVVVDASTGFMTELEAGVDLAPGTAAEVAPAGEVQGFAAAGGASSSQTGVGGSTAVGESGAAAGGAAAVGGVTGAGVGAGSAMTLSLPGLPDERFFAATDRALLIAVGIAAAGALVLAALLARHILMPVESLTAAARGMAGGDLRQRVTVRSRDELGLLGRAFNAMADSRSRLDDLRRNLVNDVAHELRTPLANLQGYLEVLRDGLTPPTPEVLATLHDESLLLSRLVADLQELALAEAGELPLHATAVPLAEPVTRALDALRPQADAKEVRLAADVADALPAALVDPARLSQILRNLLRNALAHTPPGGTVAVSARERGAEVVVAVRDTGVGIAPQHLPHIFDRFYRADPARSRATGGSGLGLAIVKHLVEAHGGRVTATSAVGTGSTFSFTLPAAAPATPTPA